MSNQNLPQKHTEHIVHVIRIRAALADLDRQLEQLLILLCEDLPAHLLPYRSNPPVEIHFTPEDLRKMFGGLVRDDEK